MKRQRSYTTLAQQKWGAIICIIWIAGSVTGAITCIDRSWHPALLLPITTVSFPVVLIVRTSVMLISLALYSRVCYALLPIIFLIAYSFALLWSSIICAFGSAGWLMSLLLLAPDALLVVLYLFFCMLYKDVVKAGKRVAVVALTVICIVSGIERYVISPFLLRLFDVYIF